MSDTDKSELEERIKQADTIPALDELRMDIVSSKSPKLLKMWQEKFWERKKKYSYVEVQALITQQCKDAQDELIGFVYRELGERKVADAMKRYQLQAKETERE